MSPHSRRSLVGLLLATAVLLASPVRAGDTDVLPTHRRLTLQLLIWDSSTGLLRGSMPTGTVAVLIQDVTRPRRARLSKLLP